jgi:N-acetylglucosamine kinase-like BadF-type ATPase
MTHTVTPIRPGLAARYGETQAVNDIHALLTAPGRLTSDEIAAAVSEIIARTGRSLTRARMILAELIEDSHGMPVARVDADGTVAVVSQNPNGPGVLIQVTTGDAAESAGLVITVDGRPVKHGGPS